jgi:hypothetical protein
MTNLLTVPAPAPESRFARVKAILDAAAAASKSDYDGLGRFWDLPLDKFREAKVYGVRLIAPGGGLSAAVGVAVDPSGNLAR